MEDKWEGGNQPIRYKMVPALSKLMAFNIANIHRNDFGTKVYSQTGYVANQVFFKAKLYIHCLPLMILK